MKTLSVKKSILLVLAATFTFLLFTGCEKEQEFMVREDVAEAAPNLQSVDDGKAETLPGTSLEPVRVTGDPGYDELKEVQVPGKFLGDPRLAINGKEIVRFEIMQIITHAANTGKPMLRIPTAKIKNVFPHHIKCQYALEFQTGGFPWRITGLLAMAPAEEMDLGLLPSFFDKITDGVFVATITDLTYYDGWGNPILSEK